MSRLYFAFCGHILEASSTLEAIFLRWTDANNEGAQDTCGMGIRARRYESQETG